MSAVETCSPGFLETALDLEEQGRRFYDQARQACQTPECREIFTILMQEEILHQARIKKIFADLKGGPCWDQGLREPENQGPRLEEIFRRLRDKGEEAIKAGATDVQAVDTGLALEEASLAYYQSRREASTDPNETAFLDQMIKEERGHYRALQDIRYYLTDPQGWLMEKEKAGLDGV